MSKTRVSLLVLFALAQSFAAANALAESPCPPVDQKPRPTDDCPDDGGTPPPPPPLVKADLVPSISSVSFAGGKVTVAMSISNQGKGAAGPTKTRIELFKQEGSGFAASAFHTQEVASSSVQPAAALALSAQTAGVPGFGPKSHRVCVTADALGQLQENSENNNKACKQFLLAVPSLPPASVPGTLP